MKVVRWLCPPSKLVMPTFETRDGFMGSAHGPEGSPGGPVRTLGLN